MKYKKDDLGTIVDFNEMYYKDKDKEAELNSNMNSKTLQATDNVSAAPPLAIASKAFQAISEEEEVRENLCGLLGFNGTAPKPISVKPGYKRLDPNAKYDRICIQMSNLRGKGRNIRANVYVSLKEDNENKFSVFLSGAMTNAKAELYRGCKNSQSVKDIIDTLFNTYPDIIIGRLRYKSVNGFISDFHKKLTKSAIIGVYKNSEDVYIAILVLYYEFIEIPLNHPLSEKQQDWCVYQGIHNEYEEFDDE